MHNLKPAAFFPLNHLKETYFNFLLKMIIPSSVTQGQSFTLSCVMLSICLMMSRWDCPTVLLSIRC